MSGESERYDRDINNNLKDRDRDKEREEEMWRKTKGDGCETSAHQTKMR